MICSSAFWKQNCENLKNISLTFFKFQSIPAYSVSGQRYYSTVLLHWVIIYNKLHNYFFVSADRQTFWGFEMTTNLRDTFPLNIKGKKVHFFTRNSVATHVTHPRLYQVIPRVEALDACLPSHSFQTLHDRPSDLQQEPLQTNLNQNARKRGYWPRRAYQGTGSNHKSCPKIDLDFGFASSPRLTFDDRIDHNYPKRKTAERRNSIEVCVFRRQYSIPGTRFSKVSVIYRT